MVKQAYFLLGLANSLILILVFLLRADHLALLKSYGWIYLLLGIPALYLIFLVRSEQQAGQYRIFLILFLAFLALEGWLDFVAKVNFRADWRILTPYLFLYYAMNYGFMVMVWKVSRSRGGLLLALFAAQLVANFITH
jgi:hypothetical protein